MNKKAVLMVNLGSPDSPSIPDVRKYLAEFLMDERVIDVPWILRAWIVYGCILPFRPKHTSEAYEKIWTPEGSPLIDLSRKAQRALQNELPMRVALAMRYQNPAIRDVINDLLEDGVEEVLLVPLYPHYAMSSYETVVERVKEVCAEYATKLRLKVLPPFYEHPAYIDALAASASDYLDKDHDHLLFSFHGVPERHILKANPSCSACLKQTDGCHANGGVPATCYRAHCYQTARAFSRAAALRPGKWSVAFQSRLGKDPWISPYTDQEIVRLAKSGVRKLQVICPAFVTDCLETIEEIGMRGRELFLEAGGEEFTLIPCLNDHPAWINALATLVRELDRGVQAPESLTASVA